MGGVLIDWNPRHVYRQLIPAPAEMERFLAEITTMEWHGAQDHGGDPAEATRRLQAVYPAHSALIAAFYDRFDEMLAPDFPDMMALVERLCIAGVPLYLLSNAPGFLDDWLRSGKLAERHPAFGRFRDYVVSGKEACFKPDAEIYELTCRRGGFRPEQAVFIDDVLKNVEGARAVGLHAIHHHSAEQTIAALRALGLPA
jgi:2-haloacid dehalogenase